MKTTKLHKLLLAGLAVSTLAASAPLFARDHDDDRGFRRQEAYERHDADERDYRHDYAGRGRHRFERQQPVVVERPLYVERETVVYRDAPQPAYDPMVAIVGAVVNVIAGSR